MFPFSGKDGFVYVFFHRALLYVVRKRVRSLLLLLICLGVGTLALSGSAIREATQTAQLNVRQALGGVFTLQQNTSDPDQWVTNDVESFGSTAYYGGTPLTEELAARIQEQVPGIKGYNDTYTNYTVPVDASGETLTLLDTEAVKAGWTACWQDTATSPPRWPPTPAPTPVLTVISPEDTWSWWQA